MKDPRIPTRNARRTIVATTLWFCAGVIIMTAGYGDPMNSLHSSAMSWAWSLAAATIGSYTFAAVWDNHNILKSS